MGSKAERFYSAKRSLRLCEKLCVFARNEKNKHMKIVWFIIALQVLFTVIAIAVIIYLILRRIRIRKKEDFEKRAN